MEGDCGYNEFKDGLDFFSFTVFLIAESVVIR